MENILGRDNNQSKLKDFNDITRQLCRGDVDKAVFEIESIYKINDEIRKEIYEVLENHEYDRIYNLKREKYTVDFRSKNKEKLTTLGINIYQKYRIKEYSNHFSIMPDMYIENVDNFCNFLRSMNKIEEDSEIKEKIQYTLEATANRIDKKIIDENKDLVDDDELQNFFLDCKSLDQECERLGLRDNTNDLRSYVTARKEKCLNEYIRFRRLGFVAELHEEFLSIPLFIRDIITNGHNEEKQVALEKNFKEIEESITLLENVRNKRILFDPLMSELQNGLYLAINKCDEKGLKHISKRLMNYIDKVDNLFNEDLGFTNDFK